MLTTVPQFKIKSTWRWRKMTLLPQEVMSFSFIFLRHHCVRNKIVEKGEEATIV